MYYLLKCPHCDEEIIIFKNELNCCIFRHAVYKDSNMGNFNPHSNEKQCINAKELDLIYGCGKPIKFDKEKEQLVICSYDL